MAAYMKGGHNAYRSTEPGYARDAYPSHVHHPGIIDPDGRKHEIIYAEYHNDKKYVQTEQVIELRHRPGGGVAGLGLSGHNLSPRGKDGYKSSIVPWRTTTDRRDNSHESPTKAFGQGAVHEKANGGSPRYNNGYIPNNVAHNRSMYSKPRKYDDSSSEDEDRSDGGSDYETDDVECKNGVCYPNPKPGARANNNHIKEYGSYDKPKQKVNFSDPYYNQNPNNPHQYTQSQPSYAVPSVTSHPRSDLSYDKPKPKASSSDPYYDQNPDNHHYYSQSPPSQTIPLVTTQPRNDASYPRPISTNPPPIKTRPDHNGRNFQEYPKKQGNKANPVTIDSTEAKRRYGGITVPNEKHPEPKYVGTIDCRAAAEKYNGIFVPGNNF